MRSRNYSADEGFETFGGAKDPGADGGLGAPGIFGATGADGIFGATVPPGAEGAPAIMASGSYLKPQNGQLSGYTPIMALTVFPHCGQSVD